MKVQPFKMCKCKLIQSVQMQTVICINFNHSRCANVNCCLCCVPEAFICAYLRISCGVSVFVVFLYFDLLMMNVAVQTIVFFIEKMLISTKV